MKYVLFVLLATVALAAAEDEAVNAESAQFMYPMAPMRMGQPYLTPMMNKKSYSSSCVRACPCVQRCVITWWMPCPCWCPPPCDDGGDGADPVPTEPPTTPAPTEPPTTPAPTSPPNDCNTCSCVWVPCTVWWMCRPRCPSTCCTPPRPPPPPCCTPCQPCTSWPCSPCNNPCNNPCEEPKKEIEKEKEKEPEPRLPNLNEWRDRLREGLNVILAPEPEPENWWEQPEQRPQGPPRPPVRRS